MLTDPKVMVVVVMLVVMVFALVAQAKILKSDFCNNLLKAFKDLAFVKIASFYI